MVLPSVFERFAGSENKQVSRLASEGLREYFTFRAPKLFPENMIMDCFCHFVVHRMSDVLCHRGSETSFSSL